MNSLPPQQRLISRYRSWFLCLIFYIAICCVVIYSNQIFQSIELRNSYFHDSEFYRPSMEDWSQPENIEISPEDEEELKRALAKAQEQEYNIVVWEAMFGVKNEPFSTNAQQCGRCIVSQDKNKVFENSTKAIIFHFNEVSLSKMPIGRRPDQLYVWWSMESSVALWKLRHLNLRRYDNFFNLTATYRRDSDVYWPYTEFQQDIRSYYYSSEDPQNEIDVVVANKKHHAIWIVSDCGTMIGASIRMSLITRLIGAGLDVDLRGRCFPLSGPVTSLDIIKEYKFYFAFENSYHCVDYITEKVFRNSFEMTAVPVVWGGKKQDYLDILPPYSCIFAEDFKTPAQLVQYLKYLDKNDTAYKEYFMWRTKNITQWPQYNRQFGTCQLCRIIHGINIDNIFHPNYEKLKTYIPMFGYPNQSRVVSSLENWFYRTENIECVEAKASTANNELLEFSKYFWLPPVSVAVLLFLYGY